MHSHGYECLAVATCVALRKGLLMVIICLFSFHCGGVRGACPLLRAPGHTEGAGAAGSFDGR